MEGGRTYTMCGVDRHFTYDELVGALNAEAATLPPETWRDGVWDVDDYIIDAVQVGVIGVEFDGDDDYPSEG